VISILACMTAAGMGNAYERMREKIATTMQSKNNPKLEFTLKNSGYFDHVKFRIANECR
jgi:hypothetical protein